MVKTKFLLVDLTITTATKDNKKAVGEQSDIIQVTCIFVPVLTLHSLSDVFKVAIRATRDNLVREFNFFSGN